MENKNTKILLLGINHFAEQGKHSIDIDNVDVLKEQYQIEICELVKMISLFKPNKIAIEKDIKSQKKISFLYDEYINTGIYPENKIFSERNEVFQIGFKTAKELNHKQIFAIDKPVNLPMRFLKYSKKHVNNFYNDFTNEIEKYGKELNYIINHKSLLDVLPYLNNPARVNMEHSNLYLHMAQVGAMDTYHGAKTLTEWYRRNIYIFGNLQKISGINDRILVVFGAGHIKILTELISNYHNLELVDTLQYLKSEI